METSRQVIGRNVCLGNIHGWPSNNDEEWNAQVGELCRCGGLKYGYCPDCKEHRATEEISEGLIAAVHGFTEKLCKCCILKRQLEFAQKCVARIEELKRELQEVRCDA